jgi:hypothetical protein
MDEAPRKSYWRRNLRLMTVLLAIWAVVSFGFGIILGEPLNRFVIGGYPPASSRSPTTATPARCSGTAIVRTPAWFDTLVGGRADHGRRPGGVMLATLGSQG